LRQDLQPAALAADRAEQLLEMVQPLEVAVLELDNRLLWTVGGEPHLDLARVGRIRVELPLAVDLPGHHEPPRRIPGEDDAPLTFGAVNAALVPAAALLRLEDRLGHVDRADVVRRRPPGVEPLGEHPEGPVDRYLDSDGALDAIHRWRPPCFR